MGGALAGAPQEGVTGQEAWLFRGGCSASSPGRGHWVSPRALLSSTGQCAGALA